LFQKVLATQYSKFVQRHTCDLSQAWCHACDQAAKQLVFVGKWQAQEGKAEDAETVPNCAVGKGELLLWRVACCWREELHQQAGRRT
jgi:hypothetical protein